MGILPIVETCVVKWLRLCPQKWVVVDPKKRGHVLLGPRGESFPDPDNDLTIDYVKEAVRTPRAKG